MEVSGYDGNKVLWEVVDGHVVEDTRENYEIGLQVFDMFFDKHKGGV